jgi:putative transposase
MQQHCEERNNLPMGDFLTLSHPPNNDDESSKRIHPARRWIVERTISWLVKRRSLRTRWSKKAENWLALVQLACAHILLNLAVFG